MKYIMIGLWETEAEFIKKAINAFLMMSTKQTDHDKGEIILQKLNGEEADNGKNN